jgi:signal transduction histidine kinase
MNRPGVSGDLRRAGVLGLLTVLGCLPTAYASTLLTQHGAPVSAVWPACAIALVVALRASRTQLQDAAVLFGATAAAAAVGAISSPGLAPALCSAGVGLLQLLLAVALARRFAPLTFPRPADGWRFCAIVGLPPPLLGAALAAALAYATPPESAIETARAWLTASILGFLLIAPFGMTISWKEIARLRLNQRAGEAVAVAALLAAVTLAAFLQSVFPLQFLILPAMLYATFRFRLPGATASAMLVAVIGLAMSLYGHGPTTLAAGPSADRALVLQLFIAVACLTMLPVAAALNQRDRYAHAIEKQRLTAVAASEAKSHLLAQVSHELRTPLSAILNFSILIERGVLSAERIPAFAAIIARNGEMLQTLADDLLDSMAAETGALSIQPDVVPVQPVLEALEIDLRPQALKARTDIVILPSSALSGTTAVTADPRRYRQILNNLATNAIKYGAGYGPVNVTVSNLGDNFLRVEFANGGPGIPLDRQEELFRPFYRAGAERGDVEGSGMGLALTKQLVELQGGRIDFESVAGGWTRFWVDLPKAA